MNKSKRENEDKNIKIIKVVGIAIVVILVIILAFVASLNSNKNNSDYESTDEANKIIENATKESQNVKEDEKKAYNEISVDEYLELYKGSADSIVLIGSSTCHYCEIAEPIVQNVAYKYDLTINYLSTDSFSDEDEANLVSSDESLNGGFGTPLMLVVGNDKIVDRLSGLTSSEYYEEFFKSTGFIK